MEHPSEICLPRVKSGLEFMHYAEGGITDGPLLSRESFYPQELL